MYYDLKHLKYTLILEINAGLCWNIRSGINLCFEIGEEKANYTYVHTLYYVFL